MKKVLLTLAMSACAFAGIQAQTVLSGNITANRTLTEPCYSLQGCVLVRPGVTLTIQAGTIILGDSATKGSLIVERGGYLIANGTSTNPIVFTSGKAAGQRRPGDWGGIILCGKAPNNQCGDTFRVEGPCFPIFAGGTNADDSSGSLQYVQIHYAGVAFTTDNEINSLTLAGVGRKTVINHIQVTNANDDAYEWFGGNVNTKYLLALDTRDDDFDTDFGYTGLNQFGFSLRLDTSKHDISGSNGFESDNNNEFATNYVSCNGGAKTHPIFSNYTVLGPKYCNDIAVNAEFRRGAHVRRNSAMNLFNSVVAGWPLQGLYVDNDPTIGNTNTDELNFSYNSFRNNNSVSTAAMLGTSNAGYWTTNGCTGSIASWFRLNGGVGTPCEEEFNNNTASVYSGICGNYCDALPSFLQTADLDITGFSANQPALNSFFDDVAFRGAFDADNDWTVGWTEWCPQMAPYDCSGGSLGVVAPKLTLVPNPAANTTSAHFTAAQAGTVRISVLDKVSGQQLRVVNTQVAAGDQQVAINLSGLQLGVYLVKVEIAGTVLTQQLVINH